MEVLLVRVSSTLASPAEGSYTYQQQQERIGALLTLPWLNYTHELLLFNA